VAAKAGIATQEDLLMAVISQNAIKHILLSYQGGISGKSRRAGGLFMQNKANFRKGQMNISIFTIKDYENEPAFGVPKSKPKQSQFQNAIWFKMGKNERESVLGLSTSLSMKFRCCCCLKPRQRLLGCSAELASQGGTNLW
jgi:hypothetical protein